MALVVVAAAAVLAAAAPASARTHWLCKPGTNASFCTPSLSTTAFSPTEQVLGVQNPRRDKDLRYDCFYVYPTVSDQKTRTRSSTSIRRRSRSSCTRRRATRSTAGCSPLCTASSCSRASGSAAAARRTPRPRRSSTPTCATRGRLREALQRRPTRRAHRAVPGRNRAAPAHQPGDRSETEGPGAADLRPAHGLGAASQLGGIPRPDVPTTRIAAPNSYDSTCQDADGADVMQISPLNGAPVLTPIPDANWGVHLTDALGNNIALVQRQFRAYERRNAAK